MGWLIFKPGRAYESKPEDKVAINGQCWLSSARSIEGDIYMQLCVCIQALSGAVHAPR